MQQWLISQDADSVEDGFDNTTERFSAEKATMRDRLDEYLNSIQHVRKMRAPFQDNRRDGG